MWEKLNTRTVSDIRDMPGSPGDLWWNKNKGPCRRNTDQWEMKSHPKSFLAKSQTPCDEHPTFLMETVVLETENPHRRGIWETNHRGRPLFAGESLQKKGQTEPKDDPSFVPAPGARCMSSCVGTWGGFLSTLQLEGQGLRRWEKNEEQGGHWQVLWHQEKRGKGLESMFYLILDDCWNKKSKRK